jgi:hypothetical protein
VAYLRVSSIPLEHLVSELAAFPLATEAALSAAPVRLTPLISNPWESIVADGGEGRPESDRTGLLWREAEMQLAAQTPGLSIDELVSLRDRIWFSPLDAADEERVATSEIPLARYLRRVSRHYLRVRGPVAVPCLQGDRSSEW